MKDRWIVVADSSRARIFLAELADGQLHEIETMAHPEGRLHEQQLSSDLPGRTHDRVGEGRHSMEAQHNPKHQEAINFAKRVALKLNNYQKTGRLASLFIIAPPEFLGLIRSNLDKETGALVIGELDKNLAKLNTKELLDHLPRTIFRIPA